MLLTFRASETDPVLKTLLDVILFFREESANPRGGPEEDG